MILIMIILLGLYWGNAKKFKQGFLKNTLNGLSLLFIAIFYIAGAYLMYFYEAIDGITFILFIFTLVIANIMLFIYKISNRIQSSNFILSLIAILAIVISYLEFPLVKLSHFDSYATYYWKSSELIEGTNLNMLGIGYKLYNSSDLSAMQELEGLEVYNDINLTNLMRYYKNPNSILTGYFISSSKNKSIENAEKYLGYEAPSIKQLKSLEGLSGDSAGLVMVLSALVNDLNFDNAISIAVTGAIDEDGKVYPIGSVPEKVQIAINDGHEYVIIPIANYEEARNTLNEIGEKIKIIPVDNVEEAFNEIKNINMN